MTGLAEAFAYFGAAGKNPRWSWSARTPDGEIVLTLWKDGFDYSTKPLTYGSIAEGAAPEWIDRAGNQERLENLVWALDHRDGEFRVVVVVAVDEKANPRQIRESYPQPRMLGKITKLNRETGEFEAVILDGTRNA